MYSFSIPDSNLVRPVNRGLIRAIKEHPEWFYSDFYIDSAYGCPPNCIWNGNREQNEPRFTPRDNWAELIAGFYKEHNVTYRLTFTNFLLKPEHLSDEYGNYIANEVSKYKCMGIVSTPMMYDYITTHYPDLDISWSTTTDFGPNDEERVKKINELSKDRVVVVPFHMNGDEFLKQMEHPENIEVLVNEECIDNCPKRREHEMLSNKFNLGELDKPPECLMQSLKHTDKWTCHSIIGRKRMKELEKMGITRFKLSGRLIINQCIASYMYYFVPPEHRTEVIDFINKNYLEILTNLGILKRGVYYPEVVLIKGLEYCDGHLKTLRRWGGLEE